MIKHYIVGCFIIFCATGIVVAQTTIPGGTVSGQWTVSGSPYLIEGEINVPAEENLTIEPGVEVVFQGYYKLIVNGTLEAIGTETDSIIFTSENTYEGWHGIRFINSTGNNVIEFCVIKYGKAVGSGGDEYGGGIYCYDSALDVGYSLLTENRSPNGKGGAIYINSSTDVNIYGNSIVENTADHGAGIEVQYSDIIIENNYICYNDATGWSGGGISIRSCSPTIQGNVVDYNTSVEDSGTGIYADFGSDPLIAFNEVAYNNLIGVFAGSDCSPELVNNTIVFNGTWAVESYDNCHYTGRNNIVWGNGLVFKIWVNSSIVLEYSDIQGGYAGTGNINADPLFVNPAGNDFHLLPDSPCIDAGDPASPLDPDSTRADMGAYYFDQSSVTPGNLTVDLEPVNPPIIVPAAGGSFEFTTDISCDETGYAFFDGWTSLILPDGQVMEPLMLRQDRYIGAGETMHFDMELYVSMWAMPGVYELIGSVGDYPDSAYASDSFTFEKLEADGAVPSGATAYGILSGWDDPETFDLPVAKAPLPRSLKLSGAPNPFNPETQLRFSLPEAGHVELTVYDISGRAIATLLNRSLEAGWHEATFDGGSLSSGIYLAVLKAGQTSTVERLLLVK